MFQFFAFAFFTASRVGEMLKLKRVDFVFSPSSADRPWVKIRLRNTKTRNRCSNDGHTLTFHKLRPLVSDPTQEYLDPYELALYWYNNSGTDPDNHVVPFSGSLSQRSKQLYRWFRDMKWSFKQWVFREKGIDLDVTSWRYHSMRTTFVGIMRGFGMSWEDIQLRTGHKFDSDVTRDTYFMNALMSNEFDEKFETMLDQNLEARTLFLLNGNLDDKASPEEQKAFRDDEKHRDIYGNPVLDSSILPDLKVKLLTPRQQKQKKLRHPKIPLGLPVEELSQCLHRELIQSKAFQNLLPKRKKAPKRKKPQLANKDKPLTIAEAKFAAKIARSLSESPAFLEMLSPQAPEPVHEPSRRVPPRKRRIQTYSKRGKKKKRKRGATRLTTHSLSLIRPDSALQLGGTTRLFERNKPTKIFGWRKNRSPIFRAQLRDKICPPQVFLWKNQNRECVNKHRSETKKFPLVQSKIALSFTPTGGLSDTF